MSKMEFEMDEKFIKVLMMTAAVDYMDNEDSSKNIRQIIDETYEREVKHQKRWLEEQKK